MPGLIVVRSRRGDAAERARTAAKPVLRRPWETFELWRAADGETAVAFAGEQGGLFVSEATGCVAAIDGEVFVGGILTSGAAAAAAVLRAYERGDELGAAEGAYAAVVWDPRTGSVIAATDRYSSRPLYIASEGETTLVAGELKAIPPVFPRRCRLDLDAVAAFLAYEHLFPRQAHLDGVEVLPPATTATITASGVTRKRRWRYELGPEPLRDEREWVEEFGRRLDSAVLRRLDAATAVTISGGLDSRCVALSMLRQGLRGPAVSYGASGSGDLSIGADVARIAGFAHRSLRLEPGYIAHWAAEAAWLYEGRFRALACHHLSLCALRDDGVRSILIGFSGDDVLRDDPRGGPTVVDAPFIRSTHARRATCIDDALLEKLAKPAFSDALRGRAEAALGRELQDDVGPPSARISQLRFRNTQAPTLFADHFPARDPFADYELVDFARTIPVELRRHGRLQRLFLQTHPELAQLPTTYHRAPPRARSLRVEVSARLGTLRHRLRPEAAAISGVGSYAADLRGESRSLLGLLVDRRTLDRGQLDPMAARSLVDRTLAGKVSDMRVIGVLLTLELFQRRFVDGDGAVADLQERTVSAPPPRALVQPGALTRAAADHRP
jgi:asparagine synthetase B (glutamine-hydrolysing)